MNNDELRIDPTISYDVVVLPSRGIHYKNKKKTIRVAYLTASDEDILSSPNLSKNISVIDELLKRKVLDRDLPIEEIVEEDRQAILIFLRNTAWGSEYKVTLIDPKAKENDLFEFNFDLSTIKISDFYLTEDSNGEYSYHLEKSDTNITFKFLTKLQEDELSKMIESWEGKGIPPSKSKELEMMIKSVNGNRDPMQIRSFIFDKMPIKDSQDFRNFVENNKPRLLLNQTVIAPSGEKINFNIGFGVEFFRPFYGL